MHFLSSNKYIFEAVRVSIRLLGISLCEERGCILIGYAWYNLCQERAFDLQCTTAYEGDKT